MTSDYLYPKDLMNRKTSPLNCTRTCGRTVTDRPRCGSGCPCIHKYHCLFFKLLSCSDVIRDCSRKTTSSLRAGPTGVCTIRRTCRQWAILVYIKNRPSCVPVGEKIISCSNRSIIASLPQMPISRCRIASFSAVPIMSPAKLHSYVAIVHVQVVWNKKRERSNK